MRDPKGWGSLMVPDAPVRPDPCGILHVTPMWPSRGPRLSATAPPLPPSSHLLPTCPPPDFHCDPCMVPLHVPATRSPSAPRAFPAGPPRPTSSPGAGHSSCAERPAGGVGATHCLRPHPETPGGPESPDWSLRQPRAEGRKSPGGMVTTGPCEDGASVPARGGQGTPKTVPTQPDTGG